MKFNQTVKHKQIPIFFSLPSHFHQGAKQLNPDAPFYLPPLRDLSRKGEVPLHWRSPHEAHHRYERQQADPSFHKQHLANSCCRERGQSGQRDLSRLTAPPFQQTNKAAPHKGTVFFLPGDPHDFLPRVLSCSEESRTP